MQGEPRFQVSWGLRTQQIFGKDVDGWKPGDTVEMGAARLARPLHTLADLPPGTYNVQAVLNVYETFHRADGHVLKLHPDHGEGPAVEPVAGQSVQQAAAGGGERGVVSAQLELTETIPPIDPPKDTKYVRHVRVQSKLLTEFWGRPIFLEATVLVPRDFDESTQHYPVAFLQEPFRRRLLRGSARPRRHAECARMRRGGLSVLPGLDFAAACPGCCWWSPAMPRRTTTIPTA